MPLKMPPPGSVPASTKDTVDYNIFCGERRRPALILGAEFSEQVGEPATDNRVATLDSGRGGRRMGDDQPALIIAIPAKNASACDGHHELSN